MHPSTFKVPPPRAPGSLPKSRPPYRQELWPGSCKPHHLRHPPAIPVSTHRAHLTLQRRGACLGGSSLPARLIQEGGAPHGWPAGSGRGQPPVLAGPWGSPQQHHKHFWPRVSPTGSPSSVSSCSGSPGHQGLVCGGPLKPAPSAPSSPPLGPPLSEPLASHRLAPWSPRLHPPTNLHPPQLAPSTVKPPGAPSPSEQKTKSLQWTPFLKYFITSDHTGLSLCEGPAVSTLTVPRVKRLDFP